MERPNARKMDNGRAFRQRDMKGLKRTEKVHGPSDRRVRHLVQEREKHHLQRGMENEALRKTQEKLQRLRIKYLNLYDFAPVGYFTFDRRGIIKEVNLAGAHLLRVDRHALIGKPFSPFVHDDDRPLFVRYCQRVTERQIPLQCEIRLKRVKGHLRYVHLQSLSEKDDEGNIVGFRTTVSDISERRKAEEKAIHSRELLRNLAGHLQTVREEERMSIVREIHDELGQRSTALKMELCWISDKYQDHKVLFEKAKTMANLTDTIIQSVKKICERLRPSLLDHLGLTAAIEWHAKEFQKHTGIACDVTFRPETLELDQDRSLAIFRIFQEALTNVVRHAEASKVKVSLEKSVSTILLTIKDNGKGIIEKEMSKPHSFGLIGIRERVLSLGGQVRIRGAAQRGTEIRATFPLGG